MTEMKKLTEEQAENWRTVLSMTECPLVVKHLTHDEVERIAFLVQEKVDTEIEEHVKGYVANIP